MELEFWGVRGTIPVSGRGKNKYGGHTPCATLIGSSGETIIVDAGTGIRELGDKLIKERRERPLPLSLLLTHFHLDHIMGLPFFAPLFSAETVITFYAMSSPRETEKYLSTLIASPFFPKDFGETKATKLFKKVEEQSFALGRVLVSHCPLHHPQGSIAYKFQEKEKSIVFATDTENPLGGIDERLVSFVQGASIFIYDATFTPEEYETGRKGWGHSTWLEGTKIAKEAKVSDLCLSHFNPDHSDRKIDRMVSLAKKEFPQTFAAREGLKIDL